MKKLSLFILMFVMVFAMISCKKEENFIPGEMSEARTKIFQFTQQFDSTKSFTFTIDKKSGNIPSIDDKSNITNISKSKTIIQYNAETKVFAYYYRNQDTTLFEVLGYIQYNDELNSFIRTNSYTKTYRIEKYSSIEDALYDYYGDQVQLYYFIYFFDRLINGYQYQESEVTKSDTNNTMRFFKDTEDVNYLFTLDIYDNYMTYKGEEVRVYSDGIYIYNYTYLLVIEDNDLQPVDISDYSLHPMI